MPPGPEDEVMTPAEVAELFRVDPKTITRWAKSGKFPDGTVVRTPGGFRRYYREKVMQVYRVDSRRG